MDLVDIKIDGTESDLTETKIKKLNELFDLLDKLYGATASVEIDGKKHKNVRKIKKIKK